MNEQRMFPCDSCYAQDFHDAGDKCMGIQHCPADSSVTVTLDAKVDCRVCKHHITDMNADSYCFQWDAIDGLCVNGDKFKPSQPIQLYEKEKRV